MMHHGSEHSSPIAALPVSRTRALTRALVWVAPAAVLTVATLSIYRWLNFVPSGVSNRIVEYSIAAIALPLPAAALWTALNALRWLLFALWPAKLGVFASKTDLTLRLGPFGVRSFDAARLDIRYLFELAGDEDDAGFEGFLPEEQQRETLLPRMVHPNSKQPLHRVILRFSSASELDAARILRPALDHWRAAAISPAPALGRV